MDALTQQTAARALAAQAVAMAMLEKPFAAGADRRVWGISAHNRAHELIASAPVVAEADEVSAIKAEARQMVTAMAAKWLNA